MGSRFLTPQEEIEAWERGDFNTIVEKMLPVATRIIRKLSKGDRYIEDEFVSFTNEVIASALKSYDPSTGYRFSTYALSHLGLKLYQLRNRLYQTNTAMVCDGVIDCISSQRSHVMAVDNSEMANHILDAVCDDRERAILLAYYSGYSMSEVGRMFSVSKQRISEINRSFLNDARKYLQKRFAA